MNGSSFGMPQQPFGPPQQPQLPFRPSGRMGIGGTHVAASANPQIALAQMMMHQQQSQGHAPYSHSNLPPGMGDPQREQFARNDMLRGGSQVRPNQVAAAARAVGIRPSIMPGQSTGGVVPGAVPAMNAVEAARAQMGQPPPGPPQGMQGRDPNDPKNAVLGAYR